MCRGTVPKETCMPRTETRRWEGLRTASSHLRATRWISFSVLVTKDSGKSNEPNKGIGEGGVLGTRSGEVLLLVWNRVFPDT